MSVLDTLLSKFRSITLWDVAAYLGVFCAYYIGSQLSFYLYFDLHSYPAVIWIPAGIALAAVYLGGYGMILPMMLAHALSFIGLQTTTAVAIVGTIAYPLQAVFGAYALRRLGFTPHFERSLSAVKFTLVTFVSAAIAPFCIAVVFGLMGMLPRVGFLELWARNWGGSVASMLIISPFILTWWSGIGTRPKSHWIKWEGIAALAVTALVTAFTFWTPYAENLGIVIIFLIPFVYVWFALRMRPRWFTAAVLLTGVIAIPGSIFSHAHGWTDAALSQQLLRDEIYIGFMAVLFLIYAAVAEERRVAFYLVDKHNKELQGALDRLAAEDKAKTEFIAILAHELRNPLAPIVSAHEWLLLQEQDPETRIAVESAQRHALMMRHLLDDLLDTARLSQRGFALKKETTSLNEVISQSVESTADFLQRRGHSLRVVRPEHDVFLFADPVRLKQVVINLLNNAGKYTEPGGRIELKGFVENGEAIIRVKDTGVGIEPHQMEEIFEPFRRVAQDMNLGTGLGIGLTLTKQLVEMHGGAISVESEGAGRGSTFEVRLPLPEQPLKAPAPQQRTPKAAHASSSRVLIVDDNEDAAVSLRKLLELHGHQVEVAHTGENGLGLALNLKPEIVLLDIGLPDVDGNEVARQLRGAGFSGRIIALTGYGQSHDKAETTRSGFDDHLTKPVNIADVLAALTRGSTTIATSS